MHERIKSGGYHLKHIEIYDLFFYLYFLCSCYLSITTTRKKYSGIFNCYHGNKAKIINIFKTIRYFYYFKK